jgi:hypothetical protein
LEQLYNIYNLDTNWDGSKVSSRFLSLYKLDCNQTDSFFFNNMHRTKSGAVQVEIYSRGFVPIHVTCSDGQSPIGYTGDLYELRNIYKFSVELTDDILKFMDVGTFSSSEITSPQQVRENNNIFKKGLEEYGKAEGIPNSLNPIDTGFSPDSQKPKYQTWLDWLKNKPTEEWMKRGGKKTKKKFSKKNKKSVVKRIKKV